MKGETDIAQLAIVLGTLGTPTEETWPGLTTLPDYHKIAFSHSEGQPWETKFPNSTPSTIDLLSKILVYNQSSRLRAREVNLLKTIAHYKSV